MSSVLNNPAALSALQSLQMTQQSLATVQNQVSTGLKVATAADNSSYWSIAAQLTADSGVVSASNDALSQGQSLLATASSAINSVITTMGLKDLSPLASDYERALLRRLADFPDEIALAARELAPHQLTFYLKDLAQEFHSYYNAERFLVDDARVRQARLALIVATGQVLRNALGILGIVAPTEM